MITPDLAAQVVKLYVLPMFKESRIAAKRGKGFSRKSADFG